MNLPANTTFEDLRWLIDLDLSSYKRCGESRMIELAGNYTGVEPWRSMVVPNYRRQAILLCLQNELRSEELKRNATESKKLLAQATTDRRNVRELKAALENEILQGASIGDYERCWRAWKNGDELEKQIAESVIEHRRTAWRTKREQEKEAEKKAWQAGSLARRVRHAGLSRDRAIGFASSVNWFAPMPIYNHTAHNDAAPWGLCQATGQRRRRMEDFLREQKQAPVGKGARIGAGRPPDLYGFKTNLLVLDKWLGDWLINSPHRSEKNTKIPERVRNAIAGALSCAIICEYADVDPDAKQFRAVLWKHWQLNLAALP
jgi:hypothetical protein